VANVAARPTSAASAPSSAGPTNASGGSRAAALAAALEDLADASDTLTIAVERHDLASLLAASERAERLTGRVAGLASHLEPIDRIELDGERIAGLRDRLSISARRNAYLIERAWALDAATMRLLAGLGQGGAEASPDRPMAAYRPTAGAVLHLDREA
jgi:hypothetical protein